MKKVIGDKQANVSDKYVKALRDSKKSNAVEKSKKKEENKK